MALDYSLAWLLGLMLGAIRVGGWLLIAPPFSHRAIPSRVKVLLSLALAFGVAPPAPEALLRNDDAAAQTVAVMLAGTTELLVGTGLGFIVMATFAAIQAAGDVIDVLGGFSLAFQFDPLTQSGSAVIGRFYQLLALTLLFASNAHLVMLAGVLRTYELVPVGAMIDTGLFARSATDVVAGMFLAAMQIAGPVVAVLFLTDVGLGLLTRVAPALNVFALGFPLKILITLVVVGLGLITLPDVIVSMTEDVSTLVGGLTQP